MADLGTGGNSHPKSRFQNSGEVPPSTLLTHELRKNSADIAHQWIDALPAPERPTGCIETRSQGHQAEGRALPNSGPADRTARGRIQGLCSPPCQSPRPLSLPDPHTMTHVLRTPTCTHPLILPLASVICAHSSLARSAEPVPIPSTWTPIRTMPSPDPSPGGSPTSLHSHGTTAWLALDRQPGNQPSGRRHAGVPAQQRE